MNSAVSLSDVERQRVQVTDAPTLAQLQVGAPLWLWLDGAFSDALERDVISITRRFDHRWVWRGTDWEYRGPGYRLGPLLVRLDEPLFDRFVTQWAPEGAGILVQSKADEATLVNHLQSLRQLMGADGEPLRFSFASRRALEELCEGLSSARLSELLGPISTLMWIGEGESSAPWLRVDAPTTSGPSPLLDRQFELTDLDEAALGRASWAWFMRDAAHRVSQDYPAHAGPRSREALIEQLAIFAREAGELGLTLERDAYRYMVLRLTYSEEPFMHDAELRAHLMRREVAGRQRMQELESRLHRTPSLQS
jgi:hypothetical protein